MTQYRLRFLIASLLVALWLPAFSQVVYEEEPVVLDDIDSLFIADDDNKPGKKSAKNDELDVSRYVLEGRYRYGNEPFSRKFTDNLYIQIGAGMKRIVPCAGSRELTPLTMINIAAGKHLNPYHTVRLGMYFGTGYQTSNGSQMTQFGLQADYLFDWSAFMRGYKPSRLVGVSSVIGLGMEYDRFNSKDCFIFDGHIGAQFKFNTGNRSYLLVEPYFSVAKNNLGVFEGTSAWRGYNLQYGVNFSIAMYLDKRYGIQLDSLGNRVQRAPFFIEYGVGPVFNFAPNDMPWTNSIGHMTQMSVGKWLSPALGLRVSYSMVQTAWREGQTAPNPGERPKESLTTFHAMHSGLSFEAMVNPLGFRKKANFNETAGFNIIAGAGGVGWLNKYAKEDATYRTTSFSVGIQAWKRLTDNLRLVVEPRYVKNIYHVTQNDAGGVFSENTLNLNIGVAMMLRPAKYRKHVPDSCMQRLRHWTFGGGGGLSLNFDRYTYDEGYTQFNWAAQGFVGYRINRIHGLRLSYDYTSHYNYTIRRDDSVLSFISKRDDGGYDMNTRNVTAGLGSLSYMLDLSNAMVGYVPDRRWNVSLLVGPTMSFLYRVHTVVYEQSKAHYYIKRETSTNFRGGGHIGLHVAYAVKPWMGLYAAPALFITKAQDLPNSAGSVVHINGMQITQQMNLGVEFNF